MFRTTSIIAAVAVALSCGSAIAQTKDAPASPSGAPAAAAQQGSSMAGEAGAKNEMKAHEDNTAKQETMANPHKQSK